MESSANPSVKRLRALRDAKGVAAHGAFLVEGRRFAADILARAPGLVLEIVLGESVSFLSDPPSERFRTIIVPDRLFSAFSDTVTSQGVAVVCRVPEEPTGLSPECSRILVLDSVSDPGNAGTLIRSAAAFGFDMVLSLEGTCSLYTPRVTRAAAAANAFIPVIQGLSAAGAIALLEAAGHVILLSDKKGRPFPEVEAPGRIALVLGSEAHGISREFRATGAASVGIPQAEEIDSLNVAAAGAILMSWIHTGCSARN